MPGDRLPKCLNGKSEPFAFLILCVCVCVCVCVDFGVQHIPVTDGSMKQTKVSLQHVERKEVKCATPTEHKYNTIFLFPGATCHEWRGLHY
jgi:hypothetical protein